MAKKNKNPRIKHQWPLSSSRKTQESKEMGECINYTRRNTSDFLNMSEPINTAYKNTFKPENLTNIDIENIYNKQNKEKSVPINISYPKASLSTNITEYNYSTDYDDNEDNMEPPSYRATDMQRYMITSDNRNLTYTGMCERSVNVYKKTYLEKRPESLNHLGIKDSSNVSSFANEIFNRSNSNYNYGDFPIQKRKKKAKKSLFVIKIIAAILLLLVAVLASVLLYSGMSNKRVF